MFALSETWLNDSISDDTVYIQGYDLVRFDRSTRGGGVGLYIDSIEQIVEEATHITNTSATLIDVILCNDPLMIESKHVDGLDLTDHELISCKVFGSSSKAMSEQKKRKVETSNDPNVWLKWYHELRDESDLSESSKDEDESDKKEENILTESEHNTESEQEVAESEEVESDEDVSLDSSSFYIGKDKITKWRIANPPRNVKTRSHNITIHLPGPKGKAREVKTEVAALELFLDDNILKTITACTNIYIEKTRQEFTRDRDARSTDEIEIRAFIGLLFLIGTMRCSRKNIHLLWDNSKGNGIESCYLTMSEQRFRFLLRCLRFDNINDRNMRKELDKMAAIREVFELFTNNCEKYFSPSEYLTIDEQLLAFRGRAAFRQYIPNKPIKEIKMAPMHKWSENETLKFVSLYKECEILWNVHDANYKNREKRNKAFEYIQQEMNMKKLDPGYDKEENKSDQRYVSVGEK
ncbi:unnamed protein product [Acanthoscelides obtectus]|uniref:PiggyBac transposable element-derived protein domain-containing protein n=1 Tax=Acanthoscelides obtectus TaxID=200917 RepID=A0A9P0KUV1_ACAOB|nr:unnamed protein product [Acanthoscelides obtectus]CAK1641938.1 PiggyBac transposable element-derived protein 4 [Acanthoscelides obtectus]